MLRKSLGGLTFLLFLSISLFTGSAAYSDDTWLVDAKGAELLTAPFGKTMYAGEVCRLAVPKGMAVRLALRSGSARAMVMLIPIKDGKRSGPKELLKDEPLTLLHTTGEADWFALKVVTGTAILDADVDRVEEFSLEEGQKITIPLIPFRQTTGRFVNLSDYRSTTVYNFLAGTDEISKTSDWDRTVSMEFKGSNQTKTWKTAADRLVVEAVHGKVLVKVGQPFEKSK